VLLFLLKLISNWYYPPKGLNICHLSTSFAPQLTTPLLFQQVALVFSGSPLLPEGHASEEVAKSIGAGAR
jgi:hypothetical protein